MTNQIWQVQDSAADGSQSTAGNDNTIKFNLTNVGDGNRVFGVDVTMRNSIPENTSLEGGDNDIEDMGIDGIDIAITGQFQNAASDITKLVAWWTAAKFATDFSKGRFGLELDFPVNFNVEPTATYGYQISNPALSIVYEKLKIVGFKITLRLGGAVTDAI